MSPLPFAKAFPDGYDRAPVRRAARALAEALAARDNKKVEEIIWRVAGDGAPGYVVFDLVLASSELAAEHLRVARHAGADET